MAPPLTTDGQSSSANAMQTDGMTWNNMVDVGKQGLPMTLVGRTNVVQGPPQPVPTNSPLLLLGMLAGIVVPALFVMRHQ